MYPEGFKGRSLAIGLYLVWLLVFCFAWFTRDIDLAKRYAESVSAALVVSVITVAIFAALTRWQVAVVHYLLFSTFCLLVLTHSYYVYAKIEGTVEKLFYAVYLEFSFYLFRTVPVVSFFAILRIIPRR